MYDFPTFKAQIQTRSKMDSYSCDHSASHTLIGSWENKNRILRPYSVCDIYCISLLYLSLCQFDIFHIQRTLVITTLFVTKYFAVIKKLDVDPSKA